VWGAVAGTAIMESLVDFNLRYPPVILTLVFSVSTILPQRKMDVLGPKARLSAFLSASVLAVLFLLPGAAASIFFGSLPYNDRARAAEAAAVIDPFNGIYRSETGRMRDLLIAIELEPRNVWYRRRAAQFYLGEWRKNKNEQSLESAMEQYAEILKAAPNVKQFRLEFEEISRMGRKAKRPQKSDRQD
jgi:hypothetical protein